MYNSQTGAVLESTANEFFLGFSQNYDGTGLSLILFVSTPEPNPVTFTVETLTGFSFNGTATSNSTTTVDLPSSLQVSSVSERDKGIRVKAEGNKKIVVYGFNYKYGTTDAFLALPCDHLTIDEYEYYVVTYQGVPDQLPATILLVGCEDDTTITVPSTTITLNKQETYLVESFSDLTGTRIAADNPVSVFVGHKCTYVPAGSRACDHLTEQVPPTATWGTSFLASSFLGRSSGEIYRVLAAHDLTTVTVNCTTFSELLSLSLDSAGNWVEFNTTANSFCSIESNNPVLVMEFGLGFTLDGVGDPFMTMIPPIKQYDNNYDLNVLPEFSTNYISVFVAPEYYQSDQIFVDSSDLQNSNWTAVSCSDNTVCGYITRVPLDSGEHKLYHEDAYARIGVLAYGFNQSTSYGYPGGLQFVPVQCEY